MSTTPLQIESSPDSQLALVGRVVPRGVADRAYDLLARMRSRLFRRPSGVCPVLAPALRARFDA